jgi:starch phosphorylase
VIESADKGSTGRQIVDWLHSLERNWASLHFGEVKVETRGGKHEFEVQVLLNDLDPNAVRVELYAGGVMGGVPVRQEMKRVSELAGAPGRHVYSAAVSAGRPPAGYTARAIPHCEGVAIPLEEARIVWQRRSGYRHTPGSWRMAPSPNVQVYIHFFHSNQTLIDCVRPE